jgi:Zinc finger, ZZ type
MYDDGCNNEDVQTIDLSFHRIDLTYHDTDHDTILIYTDDDIIAALKEYGSIGKIKIFADVTFKSMNLNNNNSGSNPPPDMTMTAETDLPRASVSTQTIKDAATEPKVSVHTVMIDTSVPTEPKLSTHTFGATATTSSVTESEVYVVDDTVPEPKEATESLPSMPEIPGLAAFTMFHTNQHQNDGNNNNSNRNTMPLPPPDFASSIANILNFAARTATQASNSAAVKEAMEHVKNVAGAMEEQAKKANTDTQQQQQPVTNVPTTVVQEETKKAPRQAQRAARQAARCARQAARSARHAVPETAATTVAATTPSLDPPTSTVEATVTAPETVTTMPSPEVVRRTEDVDVVAATIPVVGIVDRPFIHGRHTCDGCLTTPIIGKRFHSVTQKDFDLCEKCNNNYTGRDQFEEAQLGKFCCLEMLYKSLPLFLFGVETQTWAFAHDVSILL